MVEAVLVIVSYKTLFVNPENLTFGLSVNPVTWCNFNLLSNVYLLKTLLPVNKPVVAVIVNPVIPVTNPLSVPVNPISHIVVALGQEYKKLSL